MSDEQRNDDTPKKYDTPVRILTADDILAVEDINIVPVDVPEWGGMVYVKPMSALQRERYLRSIRRIVGKGANMHEEVIYEKSSALLVAMTACDAQGNPMFKAADVERLALKSAKAMSRITSAAAKLNGLADDDGQEERKNGSGGQPDWSDAFSSD